VGLFWPCRPIHRPDRTTDWPASGARKSVCCSTRLARTTPRPTSLAAHAVHHAASACPIVRNLDTISLCGIGRLALGATPIGPGQPCPAGPPGSPGTRLPLVGTGSNPVCRPRCADGRSVVPESVGPGRLAPGRLAPGPLVPGSVVSWSADAIPAAVGRAGCGDPVSRANTSGGPIYRASVRGKAGYGDAALWGTGDGWFGWTRSAARVLALLAGIDALPADRQAAIRVSGQRQSAGNPDAGPSPARLRVAGLCAAR
jgi:hypothetical protein